MAKLPMVGRRFAPVTPSDTAYLAGGASDGFFIGTAGNLVLVGEDGVEATFAVPAAYILPVGAARVRATGTTAGGIVAVYG